MSGLVTLLTDFGTQDGFVAAMKGVILGIAPKAILVDACHDIERGDVEAASFVLGQYWQLFPRDTIHLAVVDPGVGGDRRAMVLEAAGRYVVAPDNGLVSRILLESDRWRSVEIARPEYVRRDPSSTFHGRDVFAPAAGHLAAGVPLKRLGPPIEEPARLRIEPPSRAPGEIKGRVAHVDRFGNLITDIPADWLPADCEVQVGSRRLTGLTGTYVDVDKGEVLALIGSLRTVEIAVRAGSAAEKLGVARGDPVVCRWAGSSEA